MTKQPYPIDLHIVYGFINNYLRYIKNQWYWNRWRDLCV